MACSSPADKRLEEALNMAGNNRIELEKVLKHYEHDSLKLKAARFLIENMPYHIGINDYIYDPQGKVYLFDLSKYSNDGDDVIQNDFDSLLKSGYRFERKRVKDIEAVKADYLIENIELAFEMWGKSWAKDLPFSIFSQYILPYRVSNEPISQKRKELMNRYVSVLDSAAPHSSLEACMVLNQFLKSKVYFRNISPIYNSVEYIDRCKAGNCEGLATYFSYVARSLGIPCAVESTTWTKTDDGHSWCTVIDEKGQSHPFGAAELDYDQFKKTFSSWYMVPAKIYRNMYEAAIDNPKKEDGHVSYIKKATLRDVTNQYFAKTISIKISRKTVGRLANRMIYLCAFNRGEWREIAIGEETDGEILVKDVVGNNVFRIAAFDVSKGFTYLTDPFYVNEYGDIAFFRNGSKDTICVPKYKNVKSDLYFLNYWDQTNHGFCEASIISQTDSTVTAVVPRGSLIQLLAEPVEQHRRLLVMKDGMMKIY